MPVSFSFPEEKKQGMKSIKDLVTTWEKDPQKSSSLKKARIKLARKLDENGAFSLSRIRLMKGLSQTQLAERMGIFQSNIAKIENGKDDVKMSTIENLAVALGESENVIFSAISNQRRKRKIKK